MALLLVMPSIMYLLKNRTIYKFTQYYTYTMENISSQYGFILNMIVFVLLFSTLVILYFYILKNINKIFRNAKTLMIFIVIIAILFSIIIPQTSMDVYSYIGNGWVESHYNENPYYTPIWDIVQQEGNVSQMFIKVARCWVEETVVYGPAWSLICKTLTSFCGGNIDVALIIFKITSFLVFLGCLILIYKITNKKLYVAMFALNPLILFEGLSNVHNDLFLVFFMLAGIYFIYKKKNLYIAVACIAVATAIKYLSILILPFLVIYYLKNENIKTRIVKTLLCVIEFILIIVVFYMLYIKDISVLSGIFIQQNKYSRSFALILLQLLNVFNMDPQILYVIKNMLLTIFVIAYIVVVAKLFFNKNLKEMSFQKVLRKYNIFIILFTFILITNFNAWYVLWVFPTIMWQKSKMIKNLLYVSVGTLLSYTISYATHIDDESVGFIYLATIIIVTVGMEKLSLLLKNIEKKLEIANKKGII